MQNSTVSNNSTSGYGGGIYNSYGTLTVDHSTLSGNSSGFEGGGIENFGTLIVNSSVFSGNSSSNQGGAVYNRGGSMTVEGSSFNGNSTVYYGAGILNDAILTVDNSTFSGNTAGFGAGIFNNPIGSGTLRDVTFTSNVASNSGGAIWNRGPLIVDRSLFSGNLGAPVAVFTMATAVY